MLASILALTLATFTPPDTIVHDGPDDAYTRVVEAGPHELHLAADGPIVYYRGEPFVGRLTVDFPSGRRVRMPGGTSSRKAYRWARYRPDMREGRHYVTLHHPDGKRSGFTYDTSQFPTVVTYRQHAAVGLDDVYYRPGPRTLRR